MNNPNSKSLILGNASLWLVAALINPVSHLLPTSSGAPPKFFEFLIPFIVMMMGLTSTSFLLTALKNGRGE